MSWLTTSSPLFAQVTQAAPAGEQTDVTRVLLLTLVAALVCIVPFVLGVFIARSLRMRDYGVRIGLILASIAAGAAICISLWPPRLGIDLSGGMILVYEVKEGGLGGNAPLVAERVSNALAQRRVAPNAEVQPGADNNSLDVTIPGADEATAKNARRVIDGAVTGFNDYSLKFRDQSSTDDGIRLSYDIVANSDDSVEMDKLVGAISRRVNPSGLQEVTIRQYGERQIEIIVPDVEEGGSDIEDIKRIISTGGHLQFRIVANPQFHQSIITLAERTKSADVMRGDQRVAMWVELDTTQIAPNSPEMATRPAGEDRWEVLVLDDQFDVSGEYLNNAAMSQDERGNPSVSFVFNAAGSSRFGQLTGNNAPDPQTGDEKQLGIVLDNRLVSSANIKERITGQGQISGRFTEKDVQFIVEILNAGSLPAALNPEPLQEQRISSQLGDDTVEQGRFAMIVSMVLVLLVTAAYYRFAGLVACFALLMNLLLLVALMIMLKAAFTLPGLAGLVLTIGMAIDANVLIFERIREELERGSALRMAIRNGFARSTTTIIDSNLTTLITAIVLYWIGSDQIRGFAVTLILGILLSMFTAIYVARTIFDIADRKRWITHLKMTKLLDRTNYDFLGKRRLAIGLSAVIIVIGIAGMIGRGANLFDIDFTGGTSVQVVLNNEMDIAEVRRLVEERVEGEPRLPDVAVSSVGGATGGAKEFKIDTSDRDIEHVKQQLVAAFGENLSTYQMEVGQAVQIPSAAGEPSQPAAETGARFEAGDHNLLAMAAGDELLLAQADGDTPPEEGTTEEATELETAPQAPLTDLSTDVEATDEAAPAGSNTAIGEVPTDESESMETAESPAGEATATPAGDTTASPAPAGEGTTGDPAGEDAAALDRFAGGTRIPLSFPRQPIRHATLYAMISEALNEAVQQGTIDARPPFQITSEKHESGESNAHDEWTLDILLPEQTATQIASAVEADLAATPIFNSATNIGGKVAGDTKQQAIIALVTSSFFIVAYIWIRFQHLTFGLAAIVALLHDLTITVGILALSAYLAPYLGFAMIDPFKISLPVMAALLTIMGYSLNDTIVVFDRIREVRGKSPMLTEEMINTSVNQTLSRTILTGVTTIMVVLILYIYGGPGLHAFSFTMLVGVLVGTFSSIYVAAPVLLWMSRSANANAARSVSRTSQRYPAAT